VLCSGGVGAHDLQGCAVREQEMVRGVGREGGLAQARRVVTEGVTEHR